MGIEDCFWACQAKDRGPLEVWWEGEGEFVEGSVYQKRYFLNVQDRNGIRISDTNPMSPEDAKKAIKRFGWELSGRGYEVYSNLLYGDYFEDRTQEKEPSPVTILMETVGEKIWLVAMDNRKVKVRIVTLNNPTDFNENVFLKLLILVVIPIQRHY